MAVLVPCERNHESGSPRLEGGLDGVLESQLKINFSVIPEFTVKILTNCQCTYPRYTEQGIASLLYKLLSHPRGSCRLLFAKKQ